VSDPDDGISARTRLMMFLYSNRNLAGSFMALAGLGAHFAGFLVPFWFPIVVGLYGIGYLVAPDRHVDALNLGSELTADAIKDKLDDFVKSLSGKVEEDVLSRVKGIQQSIESILPRLLSQDSVGDKSLFTVRQTALEYLPATLGAYVNLPVAFRRLHVVRDGKTPKALLLEQLDLLDGKMKEIVTSVAENDTQSLLVNGRFLEEKFGKKGFFLGDPDAAKGTSGKS
jgi:hypothetical protein